MGALVGALDGAKDLAVGAGEGADVGAIPGAFDVGTRVVGSVGARDVGERFGRGVGRSVGEHISSLPSSQSWIPSHIKPGATHVDPSSHGNQFAAFGPRKATHKLKVVGE